MHLKAALHSGWNCGKVKDLKCFFAMGSSRAEQPMNDRDNEVGVESSTTYLIRFACIWSNGGNMVAYDEFGRELREKGFSSVHACFYLIRHSSYSTYTIYVKTGEDMRLIERAFSHLPLGIYRLRHTHRGV